MILLSRHRFLPSSSLPSCRLHSLLALLLLLSLGYTSDLIGQDSLSSVSSPAARIQKDVSVLTKDASDFYTSPFRFSKSDWLLAGVSIGGSAALVGLDEPARRSVGRQGQVENASAVWNIPRVYGDAGIAGGAGVATYLIGVIADRKEWRTTGRMMVESMVLAGVPVVLLKFAVGRSRPYLEEGATTFSAFQFSGGRQAFSSGHSAVAFALSTVLAERANNHWASVGFYAMATWTAYSRMHDDQHWLSDVVVGGGLGIAAGLFVIRRERERTSVGPATDGSLYLLPTTNGLSLVYMF